MAGLQHSKRSPRGASSSTQAPVRVEPGGTSQLRRLLSLGASSLHPQKNPKGKQKKHPDGLCARKISEQVFPFQTSLRGTAGSSMWQELGKSRWTLMSENDTIFWEVAERGTASPEKVPAWVRVLPPLWTTEGGSHQWQQLEAGSAEANGLAGKQRSCICRRRSHPRTGADQQTALVLATGAEAIVPHRAGVLPTNLARVTPALSSPSDWALFPSGPCSLGRCPRVGEWDPLKHVRTWRSRHFAEMKCRGHTTLPSARTPREVRGVPPLRKMN